MRLVNKVNIIGVNLKTKQELKLLKLIVYSIKSRHQNTLVTLFSGRIAMHAEARWCC